MDRHASFLISLLLLSVFAGFQFGCDRSNRQNPATKIDAQPYTLPSAPRIEHVDVKLSVESMINDAIALDQKILAEVQKGKSKFIGAMNGTDWLALNIVEQLGYVRALSDLAESLMLVSYASRIALERERKTRALAYENGNNSYAAGAADVTEAFRWRLDHVLGGRPFGDLISAITEFYQRKPLLKDKPVLWVLAVPLYKEIQESHSKPQPGSVDDAIEQGKDKVVVTMVKKQ